MKTAFVLIVLSLATVLRADWLPNAPYVYAIGTASREVPPDFVKIYFFVEHTAMDPAEALKVVHEKAEKIFLILKENKIPDGDIEASKIQSGPKFEREYGKKTVFLGTEVSRSFNITIRNLSAYETIVTQLVNAPVDNLYFSGTDIEDSPKFNEELNSLARADARKNADTAAAALGCEVIGVYAIAPESENSLKYHWQRSSSSGKRRSEMENLAEEVEVFKKRDLEGARFIFNPITLTAEAHVIFLIRERKAATAAQ